MKLNGVVREIISTVLTFGLVFLIALGLQRWVVQSIRVDGHSMDYTLEHNERLFLWRLANIERFDVVVLEAPTDDKLFVKRVIGVPGDTIEYRNDQLILNGQSMEEPYLDQMKSEYSDAFTRDFTLESVTGESVVPEGYVFVLGDNRRNSVDSRTIGFVSLESILGEADVIYWPLNRVGLLTKYELNDAGSAIIER